MTRQCPHLFIALILLVAACQSSPLPSETSDTAWQVWRNVTQPDAVHAIAVDGERLWLGTSFGVLRYDPKSESFDHFEEIGITTRLLLTPEGSVWAASTNGLYYFDSAHWNSATFSKDFQPYANRVYQLGIDQSGDLFVAAGVSRGVRGAHFSGHIPPADREWPELINVTPAAPNPFNCSGWQAMTTINRAYRSPEECEKQTAAEETLKRYTPDYPNIVIDGDGSVWWATSGGINHLVNETSTAIPIPRAIYAMAADPKHGVWLGTDGGLMYYNERQAAPYSLHIDRPIFPGTPSDMAIDTGSQVYTLSADTGELYTLDTRDQRWRVRDVGQFAATQLRGILSIAAAPDGGLWATHGTDLFKIGGAPRSPPRLPVKNCTPVQLSVDAHGDVWSISPACNTILRYDLNLKRWLQYQISMPYFESIRALSIAADGTLYVFGVSGIYSHSNELTGNLDLPLTDWQPVAAINEPLHASLDAAGGLIAADPIGGLWIGSLSTGEIWHYAGNHLTSAGRHFDEYQLSYLYVDRADRLWAAGLDKLMMFDGQTWHAFKSPGLGFVSKMFGGPDGRIWLVGQQGIAVYDPSQP